MSIKTLSVAPKILAQSILSTASSFALNNISGWDGNDLTSSDFGSQAWVAFLSADRTKLELMEIDPSTIADSTITILYRGLKFDGTQTTEVSANKLDWTANETTVMLGSDIPQLMSKFGALDNAQTWSALNTFSTTPKSTAGLPTDSEELSTKQYVDNTATGTTHVNNLRISGDAGETVAVGELIYLKEADNEWYQCDANTAATVDNVQLGFAQGSGTDGNAITSGVLTYGIDGNQTGLTPGATYYASDTAGEISSSAGTVEVTIGTAKSATEILLNARYNQQITEDQQDALAGTSGTPSSSNKYVTADDVTEAKTASKIARRDSNSDVLVATTPTDGDAATSKTYVDNHIFDDSVLDLFNGAGKATTVKDYWTFDIPFLLSTNVPSGDFWTFSSGNISFYKNCFGSKVAIENSVDSGNNILTTNGIWVENFDYMKFNTSKKIIIEFGWQLRATGGEEMVIGLGVGNSAFQSYNYAGGSVAFTVDTSGNLYAKTGETGVGHTETQITGITLTNENTYRIEFDPSTDAKFYVNGTLEQTITTYLPDESNTIYFGFGFSGNSSSNDRMTVTKPYFAIEK